MGDGHDNGVARTVSQYLHAGISSALIAMGALGLNADSMYAEEATNRLEIRQNVEKTTSRDTLPFETCEEDSDYIPEETDVEELVDDITRTLARKEHAYRAADAGGTYNEGFSSAHIPTAHLIDIDAFLESLQQDKTRERLGELVRKDLQDDTATLHGIQSIDYPGNEKNRAATYTLKDLETGFEINAPSTEIGGLVFEKDDTLHFQPYQPRYFGRDSRYIIPYTMQDVLNSYRSPLTSSDLIPSDLILPSAEEDTDRHTTCNDPALAWFHLHAIQDSGNAKYAGPSHNDFIVSRRIIDEPGVVVTYLGTDDNNHIQINIDYISHQIIDLGSIERSTTNVIDLGNYDTDVSVKSTTGEEQ